MYKIRIKLLSVVFCGALVPTGTSNAMLTGVKQGYFACYDHLSKHLPNQAQYSTTSKPILPFESAQEKCKEYEKLADTENYLFDSKKTNIKDSEKEKHINAVLRFWERLTRDRVKKDIANKKPYTRALGLKEKDGVFTMTQRPMFDENDIAINNQLLFLLSVDPDNKGLANNLKMFHKYLHNSSKSGDMLFPRIVVLPNNSNAIPPDSCFYVRAQNILLIRKKDVCIKKTDAYLHEDTHHEQFCVGIDTMGGIGARPLNGWKDNATYPLCVAWETDAENQKIKKIPHPKKYIAMLEKDLKNPDKNYSQKDFFPYKTGLTCYADTVKEFKLKGNPAYLPSATQESDLYKKLDKQMGKASKNPNKLKKMADPFGFIAKSRYIDESLQKGSQEYLESIQTNKKNVKNYQAGCNKFLTIKQNLELIPKE